MAVAGPSVFPREKLVIERPKPFVVFCVNVALRPWQNGFVDCAGPELRVLSVRNQPFNKGFLVCKCGFGGVNRCSEGVHSLALAGLKCPLKPRALPVAMREDWHDFHPTQIPAPVFDIGPALVFPKRNKDFHLVARRDQIKARAFKGPPFNRDHPTANRANLLTAEHHIEDFFTRLPRDKLRCLDLGFQHLQRRKSAKPSSAPLRAIIVDCDRRTNICFQCRKAHAVGGHNLPFADRFLVGPVPADPAGQTFEDAFNDIETAFDKALGLCRVGLRVRTH